MIETSFAAPDGGSARWTFQSSTTLLVALVAFGAAFDRMDVHHALVAALAFGIVGGIAVHDFRTRVAPNAMTYPGVVAIIAAAFTLGLDAGGQAVGGALISFSVVLIVALAGRGRMGMGDVKMAAVCGATVGISGAVPMLMLTFAIGAIIAGVALLSRLRRRTDSMAFTPLLAASTAFVSVALNTYLSW